MDEDDDDLFAEFDVDMDMEKDTTPAKTPAMPPPASTTVHDPVVNDVQMDDADPQPVQAASKDKHNSSSDEAAAGDDKHMREEAALKQGQRTKTLTLSKVSNDSCCAECQ